MMITTRHLGTQPYLDIWDRMKRYTAERTPLSHDELWLLEHPPIYTQGQAGKAEHILDPGSIPIVQSDRGGQVTYHGPGQLVAYVLMDIKRRNLGIRTLVCRLEKVLITSLNAFNIPGKIRSGAPGVYVHEKKIASIGLRVRQGCTYHGIALNVSMDLKPFDRINPCGYTQLQMTQIKDYVPNIDTEQVSHQFVQDFLTMFEP